MTDTASPTSTWSRLLGAESDSLMTWWQSLDDHRGERARLRRADAPDDVLLTDAFFRFLQEMPQSWAETHHLPASALVAATLAHVKEHQPGTSFARQLATPQEGERPVMSELRFRQLLKSRSPEEFFRRLLRAVRILGGKVDIVSLTEGMLHWYDEYLYGPERNPINRLAVKWAQDYYLNLKN